MGSGAYRLEWWYRIANTFGYLAGHRCLDAQCSPKFNTRCKCPEIPREWMSRCGDWMICSLARSWVIGPILSKQFFCITCRGVPDVRWEDNSSLHFSVIGIPGPACYLARGRGVKSHDYLGWVRPSLAWYKSIQSTGIRLRRRTMAVWCHVDSFELAVPVVSIRLISGRDRLDFMLASWTMVRNGVGWVRTMLIGLVIGDNGTCIIPLEGETYDFSESLI